MISYCDKAFQFHSITGLIKYRSVISLPADTGGKIGDFHRSQCFCLTLYMPVEHLGFIMGIAVIA